jgi:peptidoglycan/xylan/chitin deacetylase (PgdA/CDA1 family)
VSTDHKTLVLCYHAVSERWPDPVAVTPAQLERQLTFLRKRGFVGSTFSEALARPPAQKTVAVTFDDGYRSVIERAFPILERFEMPGTVFVPSRYASAPGPRFWQGKRHEQWLGSPFEAELTGLSWEELGQLIDSGWEVASHSRSHPHLTELPDRALRDELLGSRQECERSTGKPCLSLSYPYGDHDQRVIQIASEVGYRFGATLPRRFPSKLAALQWPRVGIYRPDSWFRFRVKTSPLVLRLRRTPFWRLIGSAAARLGKQGEL